MEKISSDVQYLQLQSLLSFTLLDFNSLSKCRQLRVLSVTSSDGSVRAKYKHSVSVILAAVSQLPLLQYFHWCQGLNLTTHSLLCPGGLLTKSFRSLCHFHVNFSSLLLSTTDLTNKKYSVLKILLVLYISHYKNMCSVLMTCAVQQIPGCVWGDRKNN